MSSPTLRPVVGIGSASCCTVLSAFGVVFLTIVGWGYDHDWEAFMGSTNDPKDGHAVARTCYTVALIYLAFLAFCGCQIGVHKRYSRVQI